MPKKKMGRAPVQDAALNRNGQCDRNASAPGSVKTLELADAYSGDCPVCGSKNKLTVKRRPDATPWLYWYVDCWVCEGGRAYLSDLAGCVGCAPYELLAKDGVTHLEFFLDQVTIREGKPGPLPSSDQRRRWRENLLGSPDLLAALLAERGLRPKAIRRFRVGWDASREGYTLPVLNAAGELVNVSWRARKGQRLYLPGGQRLSKYRVRSRTADNGCLSLYPMPLPPGAWWLLVEGEWDALLARQEGLPAITGLLGKQWNAMWDPAVAGQRIAVVYDVGAEADATKTARRLTEAGADAWQVSLGLPHEGDDVVDWFVTYGRSADELRALVRRGAEV